MTLTVDLPQRAYPIHIGGDVLPTVGKQLSTVWKPCRAAIVSDENVWALYGAVLTKSLQDEGFAPFPIVIPAGEASKSLGVLETIYEALHHGGLLRDEPLIALGGGVVGDIAGLAAATYGRGVPFVQVPTTLLAQVDSSVGGKVAVNLKGGKNLVGAFYQPKMVFADTSVLQTLPDRDFASGMAEVIKYVAIDDVAMLPLLETCANRQGVMAHIDEIVFRCCDSKRKVVLTDELDYGQRMILNFGHTFGHALETLTNYTDYTHGEAVAIGMVMATKLSRELAIGITLEQETRLTKLLQQFSLPTNASLPKQDILSTMVQDKKNTRDTLRLILLQDFGKPSITPLTYAQLEAAAW